MAIKFNGFDVLGVLAQRPDILKNAKVTKSVAKLDSIDEFNKYFDTKMVKNNLKDLKLERTPATDTIERVDSMSDFPGIM